MCQLSKKLMCLFSIIVFSSAVFSQQQVSLDWKVHNVGKVKQFVCNLGSLWPTYYLWNDYSPLIYSEFLPDAPGEEHIGEGGIWVGGMVNGDSLVSVTTGWNSYQEFFPTGQPWDTIWVVNKLDTVDIPYWPGYVGVSDQDFVCRYSDYNVTNIVGHQPMYLDVIQTSFAWANEPLDEFIVYQFYVIPTQTEIQNAYIAYWLDGNVGYCEACRSDYGFGRDDRSWYYPDRKLGMAIDPPGGTDGTAISPIAVQIFTPDDIPDDSLEWTFNWYPGGYVPPRDGDRYAEMAAGTIMQNQQSASNGSQFIISFGPLNLSVGDTFKFTVGEILGEGEEGVLNNSDRLEWLVNNDFHVPSPPPPPPLRVDLRSNRVKLHWAPRQGDVNPERYQDPYRGDEVDQPFEGYRVYKSTKSKNGPWTLLAEFDIEDNGYGQNAGLAREYEDTGLLDYFEYFYTVTAFSKEDTSIDYPSQESSVSANATTVVPGPMPQKEIGKVAVVPNPYRGDISYDKFDPPWEKPPETRKVWLEQDRKIFFIELPQQCEIKIFTLAGDLVRTIQHNDPVKGYEEWNLTSSVGQAVSSGIYLYTVENLKTGEVQVGKFVIIK